MMKDYFKIQINTRTFIIKMAIISILAVGICCSSVLLYTEKAYSNLYDCREELENEGVYPRVHSAFATEFDNWTEDSYLDFLYNGMRRGGVDTAFANWELYEGETGIDHLLNDMSGEYELDNENYTQRPTYWCGYRIFTLIGLNITDYFTARNFNWIFHWIVAALMIAFLIYNKEYKALVAFLAAFFSANIWVYYKGFTSGGFVVSIALLSYMVYQMHGKKGEKYDTLEFFAIVGALTSYFDWFSNPLLSFGILMTLFIFNSQESNVKQFNLLWNGGLGWLIGYGYMLSLRQIMSIVFLGKDAILYFMDTANKKVNVSNGLVSKIQDTVNALWGVVTRLTPFNFISNRVLLAAIVGLVVLMVLIMQIVCRKEMKVWLLNFMFLLPVIWFFTFSNFTVIHAVFVYKLFYISVCAFVLMAFCFVEYMLNNNLKRGIS